MRTFLSSCLLCFLVVAPLGAQSAPSGYDSLFDQLMALPTTSAAVFSVSGVTFRRDAATFTLKSGQVQVLGAIDGRPVALAFKGTGTLAFAAPTRIEREQLHREFKIDSLVRDFGSLFLLFADTTAEEVQRGAGATGAGAPVPAMAPIARKGLEYLGHRGRRYFDTSVMATLLNHERNATFFAMVDDVQGGPYLFQVDPGEPEEVSLSRGRSGDALAGNRAEVMSRFDWAQDSAPGSSSATERKERFGVKHYAIESTIRGNMAFRASAQLTFDWYGAPHEWFPLYLYPDLKVDSASWDTGPATVVQTKDNPVLWVRRPEVPAGAAFPVLRVHYQGKLLDASEMWVDLKTSNGWYPQVGAGYGSPATSTFDLVFHTPRGYKFASVGELTENELAGDVLTTHWITREPSVHASFNMGKFEELAIADPRAYPVRVLVNQLAHDRLPSAYQDRDGHIQVILRQKDMKGAVGEDVTLSLAFFKDAFGEPPGKAFSATEISGGHGQAFPGLIHFSWVTYQGFVLEKGEDEAFRAHEVAHQWWGLGVGVKSYRDAWISEGFATFAGWWYTEAVLGDTIMTKVLKRSRESIMPRRAGAGPIWLGTRLGSDAYPQDYSIVVYDKAAWVLRMLRGMMRDETAPERDGAFQRLVRDFYRDYRGKLASTDDFRVAVERALGGPVDWFFNSWVYGTGIPTYEWATTTEAGTDGKTSLKIRVAQKEVPDGFAMIVPLRLEFADGTTASHKVMVKGPTTEVAIAVPAKPKRVVFNPSDAVLAEVKEVRWR